MSNEKEDTIKISNLPNINTNKFPCGLKRFKKNWVEYAKEKDTNEILPIISSNNLHSKYKDNYRKQILAKLIEKKKKSMATKYKFGSMESLHDVSLSSVSKNLSCDLINLSK